MNRNYGMAAIICTLSCPLSDAPLAADAELESLEREYEALEAAEYRRVSELKAREKARAEAIAKSKAQAQATQYAEQEARTYVMRDAGGGVLVQIARGLQWTQSDNGSNTDWNSARAFCASRGDDWRLPTVTELESLLGGYGTACGGYKCNVSPRFRLSHLVFWSSERESPSMAWTVDLRSGLKSSYQDSYDYYTRALCVRAY